MKARLEASLGGVLLRVLPAAWIVAGLCCIAAILVRPGKVQGEEHDRNVEQRAPAFVFVRDAGPSREPSDLPAWEREEPGVVQLARGR